MYLKTTTLESRIFRLAAGMILVLSASLKISGQGTGPQLILEENNYTICEGETAIVRISITGTPDVWLRYEHNGTVSPLITNSSNSFSLRLTDPGMYIITSYGDANRPGTYPPDTFNIVSRPAPDITFSGGGVNCSEGMPDPLVAHFSGEPNFWFHFYFNGVRDSLETGLMQLVWPTDESFTLETISIADNNCSREIDLTADYRYIDVPIPELIGDTSVCAGSVELYRAAEPDFNASWDIPGEEGFAVGSDEQGDFMSITWLATGNRQILLRYTEPEYNCSTDWELFTVQVNPLPQVRSFDTLFCFDLQEDLDLQIEKQDDESIYWTELNTIDPVVRINETGTYHYIMTNDLHCSDTGSVGVISNCMPELYVPEAFTPNNGDALNDVLLIFGIFTRLDFRIYSSTGILLFRTTEDPLEYWDGTFEGKDLPAGRYYWSANFSVGEGEQYQQKGAVNIIR